MALHYQVYLLCVCRLGSSLCQRGFEHCFYPLLLVYWFEIAESLVIAYEKNTGQTERGSGKIRKDTGQVITNYQAIFCYDFTIEIERVKDGKTTAQRSDNDNSDPPPCTTRL